MFDAIPRWFSDLTLLGLDQTASYRLPDEIESTLRRWHPRVVTVAFLPYRSPRSLARLVAGITNQIPVARHGVPSLVHVTIAHAVGKSTVTTAIEASLPLRTSRKQNMTSMNDNEPTANAMGGFLAVAAQNSRCSGDIALPTTKVIAKRVALGMAATFNPLRADRAEFSRIVPEKVKAFSAAGMVILNQSGQANRQMIRSASDEVMATARATIEMTGCSSPAALAEAQSRFVRAWLTRATSNWITIGIQVFEAQAAAMAPIRQTVVANAERLGQ